MFLGSKCCINTYGIYIVYILKYCLTVLFLITITNPFFLNLKTISDITYIIYQTVLAITNYIICISITYTCTLLLVCHCDS